MSNKRAEDKLNVSNAYSGTKKRQLKPFMRNRICFLVILLTVSFAAIAQQDPQISFYKQGRLMYNPGFAGTSSAISALLLNRYQWTGIEGAPKTLLFSAETATELLGIKSGIGFNVISDELGLEKNTLVNLNYSYLVQTDFGNLGIGASLGFFNKSIENGWEIPDGSSWHTTSDSWIPQAAVSEVAFDAGLGVFLKSADYFAGISVTHLNEGKISFEGQAYTYYTRHYYFTGGYTIPLPNPLFTLQPSLLYKTDLSGAQLDLTADLTYNERFTGGISYRLNDGFSFQFSVELLNGIRAGYAYDLITSALGAYTSGSHEFFLSYSFAIQKGRSKKYKSVRYL